MNNESTTGVEPWAKRLREANERTMGPVEWEAMMMWQEEAICWSAERNNLEAVRGTLWAWRDPVLYWPVAAALRWSGPEIVELLIEAWRRLYPAGFQSSEDGKVAAEQAMIDQGVLAAAQRGEHERVAWLKGYASAEGRKAAEGVLDGPKPASNNLPRRPKP
jgi:hypothetical protein